MEREQALQHLFEFKVRGLLADRNGKLGRVLVDYNWLVECLLELSEEEIEELDERAFALAESIGYDEEDPIV